MILVKVLIENFYPEYRKKRNKHNQKLRMYMQNAKIGKILDFILK